MSSSVLTLAADGAKNPLADLKPVTPDKESVDVATKYANILFEPLKLGTASILFSKTDSALISEALEVYDKSARALKADAERTADDDLSSLLNSIKSHAGAQTEAPKPLHNLYLGSIVYYSAAEWSVWINGKKLTNLHNHEGSEFYVPRISRTEVEIVWKPSSLQQVPVVWKQLTDGGKQPLPHVNVDGKKGTVTLLLHPNQTFLPRTLAIREGLVISSYSTSVTMPPLPTDILPTSLSPSPVMIKDPASNATSASPKPKGLPQ